MITYDPTCPECGGAMVVRHNKETDEPFYGCSFFPECRGTRSIKKDNDATEGLPSDRQRRSDKDRWRQ